MSRSEPRFFLLVALAPACFQQAFDNATDYQDGFATTTTTVEASDAGTSTGETHPTGEIAESTLEPPGIGSSTTEPGASDTTSGTSSPDDEILLEWSATPAKVLALGPVVLGGSVSDNVVEVDLLLDGEFVATTAPISWTWPVLSHYQNGSHTWTVVARTAKRAELSQDIPVEVQVPLGGQEKWHTTTLGEGVATGVAVLDDVAWIIGTQASEGGGELVLRQFQADVLTTTATPTTFSKLPEVQAQTHGVDVAVAPDGALIVAGNVLATQRRYTARLTPDAATAEWEKLGNPGEVAAGVAVDDAGRVYQAGLVALEAGDTIFSLWSWDALGGHPWVQTFEDATDAQHDRSERATAVAVVDELVVAVGVRDVWLDADQSAAPRSMLRVYNAGGLELEALRWTSEGDWGGRDAALDVVAVGAEFCLTGWSGSLPQALTRCSDGLVPWWSTRAPIQSTGRSIGVNPLGEPVVAGERWGGLPVGQQGWVAALVWGSDELEWEYLVGDKLLDMVLAVACGPWGPCVYGGLHEEVTWQWMVGAVTPS